MITQRQFDGELAEQLGHQVDSAVLGRIYAARGVSTNQLASPLSALARPDTMDGMATAVALLISSLKNHQRLVIVADFDVDGATSCALLMRGLTALGYRQVDYLVPNRFDDGYGLTANIAEQVAQRGCDLLITVDNGITSHAGVERAHELKMQVLITDHHLPAPVLPDADAIIDPNLSTCDFPSKALAGVGVAFYLLLALRAELRQQGWFQSANIPEPNMAQWIDLVALGTVADVAQLDYNNRILVAQGLQRIRTGRAQAGLQALLEVGGRAPNTVVAADLGFAVGPRLNAAGRLEDMSVGIECLLTDSPARAAELAQQLDQLNRQRREIEGDMKRQAFKLLDQADLENSTNRFAASLFHPDWHQGVIGILASRIKARLHRPVVAFASADDGLLKGSARSIDGVHIRDQLAEISRTHPEMLKSFGGHAMAAGLTILETDLALFSELLDQQVGVALNGIAAGEQYLSDGPLSGDEFTLELVTQLRGAGPWGAGFEEPCFDGEFELVEKRTVGDNHLKMKLRWPGQSRTVNAIAFSQADECAAEVGERLRLLYRPQLNDWQGNISAEFLVERVFELK
ncbi:MAG: single-stranded-DNA-specific exonuclease RecJ [Immundisolibacteraceae bacterium]|nr:single-stranded-DNA-specific exonuclease RecJ [Immundisolibacteraceae bacterium]